MLNKLLRFLSNLFFQQDYVRFKISSDCTCVIKSCVSLNDVTVVRIKKAIQEYGYRTQVQQNTLLLHLGVYFSQKNIFKGVSTNLSCNYVPNYQKGTGKFYITLSNADWCPEKAVQRIQFSALFFILFYIYFFLFFIIFSSP